jgi:hypothetical protein
MNLVLFTKSENRAMREKSPSISISHTGLIAVNKEFFANTSVQMNGIKATIAQDSATKKWYLVFGHQDAFDLRWSKTKTVATFNCSKIATSFISSFKRLKDELEGVSKDINSVNCELSIVEHKHSSLYLYEIFTKTEGKFKINYKK